jgi:hypothetical protein
MPFRGKVEPKARLEEQVTAFVERTYLSKVRPR